MAAILLRLLIYLIIFGAIYFGIRKILTDWRNRFRDIDQARRERDLKERDRPDVVELKRDSDGIFRPGAKNNDQKNKSDQKNDRKNDKN